MEHVVGVEAVVTQLVHQYLVGGEIAGGRLILAHFLHGKQQRRLGYLASVKAVFGISVRAYGEGDVQVRIGLQ